MTFSSQRWLIALAFCACQSAQAQFSLTGQVRTRSEYRDGLGTLNPIGTKPAFFTSQRTGLNFGYKSDRLLFGVTVRDVRVWGQDASTINNADGNKFFVHEAWGELILANKADTTFKYKGFDNLSVRLGRQEWVYDDVRLLGNLDWLQQARRFDAVLFKGVKKGWQIDLGLAFNQNTDAFGVRSTNYTPGVAPAYVTNSRGNLVTVPGGFIPTNGRGGAPVLATVVSTNGQNQQYKALQFLYLAKKIGQTKLSLLALRDQFSRFRLDSLGNSATGVVYGRRYDVAGTNNRFTYGAMLTSVLPMAKSKLAWQAFAYGQGGRDVTGTQISAYYLGANAQIQQGKWAIGPGYEILSGNNTVSPSGKNNRFDPLYGTPHKHWGYMDYFYVGTGSPVGGLANAYLKYRYTFNPNLFLTIDLHHFALANDMVNTLDANRGSLSSSLGQELDILLNYNMNRFSNLELGYGYFAATNSLEFVKLGTIGRARHNAHWLYLMLNLRPDFLSQPAKK